MARAIGRRRAMPPTVAALRRASVAGRRTGRRMAQAQPDPLRTPIVRLMRALVRGPCRAARARVRLHRAIATTGHPAATARISRNRAPTLRATTTIARHTRTAAHARMSRRLARTAIAPHPPIPRRAAVIPHRRARTRRPRVRIPRRRAHIPRLHVPTRPRAAATLHLRTRLLRARTLHRAAATPRPPRAMVAVAGAITAAVAVEAIMAAVETVVAADRTVAVGVAAEVADRTVAVAVPVAAAPTATNSRCDVQARSDLGAGLCFSIGRKRLRTPQLLQRRPPSVTTLPSRKCLIARSKSGLC